MSWRDNRYSPLYRPAEAAAREPRLMAVAFSLLAAFGVLLLATLVLSGPAAVVTGVLAAIAGIGGGAAYTAAQIRAAFRKSARRPPDPR